MNRLNSKLDISQIFLTRLVRLYPKEIIRFCAVYCRAACLLRKVTCVVFTSSFSFKFLGLGKEKAVYESR